MLFNLSSGDTISGSVSISGLSDNYVNFYVTDPTGAQIYNAGRVSAGTTFSFTASTSGAHVLHFDNSFLNSSEKYIVMSYGIEVTLIPGVSPAASYAIIVVIFILALALPIILTVALGTRGFSGLRAKSHKSEPSSR